MHKEHWLHKGFYINDSVIIIYICGTEESMIPPTFGGINEFEDLGYRHNSQSQDNTHTHTKDMAII